MGTPEGLAGLTLQAEMGQCAVVSPPPHSGQFLGRHVSSTSTPSSREVGNLFATGVSPDMPIESCRSDTILLPPLSPLARQVFPGHGITRFQREKN